MKNNDNDDTMKDKYHKDPTQCLKINEDKVEKKIIEFIKKKSNCFNGVVVGLSGGIDSAIVATLATKALSKDKVFSLVLPSETTPEDDIKDAIKLANKLDIIYETVDITDIYNTIKNNSFSDDRIGHGNIMARIRMILLRDYAHTKNLLVLGTGNKSELMLGYFTKNGDGGIDILPIGDLYKTQVRSMATHLNIDKNIIKKPPSAGLWLGQTDEDDIGTSYETIDKILKGLELNLTTDEISKTIKVNGDTVNNIKKLIKHSRHKTEPIPILKLI